MISILYLFEGTPKGFVEKGKTDIPKTNNKFFARIFKTPEGPKRQKLMKAHMKHQNRVVNSATSRY